MPESSKPSSKAAGNDNLGQSGTDQFPTYQDEAGLKGQDKPKEDAAGTAKVEFNHGEESPAAKAEREEMEKNPPSPTPVQMLPENQDDTVK